MSFGCSFTYGYGLKDCRPPPNDHVPPATPSNYAWPSVCAKILNLHCLNQSVYGSGNKHIAYQILNFEFKPNDIVVPMWTFFSRHSIIVDNNKILDLHSSLLDDVGRSTQLSDLQQASSDYYGSRFLSNQKNQIVENLMYVNLIDLYLRHRNIRVVHTTVPLEEYGGFNPLDVVSSDEQRKSLRQHYQKLLRDKRVKHLEEYSLAMFAAQHAQWFTAQPALSFSDTKDHGILSDGHPTESSHRAFAERLAQYITENAVDSP